jgi:hypothetical protein
LPLEHYSLGSQPKHSRDIGSSNTVGDDSLEHGNLPRVGSNGWR